MVLAGPFLTGFTQVQSSPREILMPCSNQSRWATRSIDVLSSRDSHYRLQQMKYNALDAIINYSYSAGFRWLMLYTSALLSYC